MSIPATAPSKRQTRLDRIELDIPLRAEFAATVRTVAASLGVDAGFSIDELDDVRLAINEVFSILVDQRLSDDDRGHVVFSLSTGRLDVQVGGAEPAGPIELDDLAENIIRSVTDTFEVTASGVTLTKRGVESPNAAAP